MGKFDNVTVEDETTVVGQNEIHLGSLPALLQHWKWEGISASSLIFVSVDVKDVGDDGLKRIVHMSGLVEGVSSMTIKRNEDYTFVNFNFRY